MEGMLTKCAVNAFYLLAVAACIVISQIFLKSVGLFVMGMIVGGYISFFMHFNVFREGMYIRIREKAFDT